MRTRLFALSIVLCLLVGLNAFSQERTSISGVVRNETGQPLAGVAVALEGPERRDTLSGASGEFAFTGLKPGTYQLRLTRAGFKVLTVTAPLATGEARRLTLTLTSVSESKASPPPPATREMMAADSALATAMVGGQVIPPSYFPFGHAGRYPPGSESYASNRREPLPPRLGRPCFYLLRRRRYRVIRQRPPLPQ